MRIRQFNYYSKKHIDAAFAKYDVDNDLTEWYTPEEIQEKYGMTCVAIRSQVTRERTFNDSMTEKAEAIRCRRYESIVNDRYDFLDKVYIYLFLFATLPPPFIKYNLSQYTILTASIYNIHVHNILYCI